MVSDASEFVGVNVATVSVLSKVVVPGTEFPLGSVTVNDTVLGTTALENVTVGAVDTGLLVRPGIGRDTGHRRCRAGRLRRVEDHVDGVARAVKLVRGETGSALVVHAVRLSPEVE